MPTQREIIICKNCKGEGVLRTHRVTCYHKNEYDVITFECAKCDGEGRVWQITEIKYEKVARRLDAGSASTT